ncbi:MAG: phosphoglycerate dehydrogenase [Planctomycetes bacterium]|nr:phosphoglycerate dehydrogenase [Planctomycetota bacterium]
MKTRILVADELSEEGMGLLRAAGEVTVRTGMDEDALRQALPPFHALIVRSATQVTARSLELASTLSLIGRAGIGVDNIDVDAATERGIVVMNTPEANAVTTGEHAVALLVSLARCIPAADASIRAGKWEKSKFTGVELLGKQAGILGLGRIGRVVAERCRGLGMTVAAYDPFVSQKNAPDGVRMMDLDDLLQSSDFVSVHVPLLDETRGLLSTERIAMMKPGARLVHAARGGIVDEVALCAALHEGRLAGAALDVFEQEPLAADSPLRTAPNLVLTPHLGASTHEAKRNVSLEMGKQVALALQHGVVLNGVNVPRLSPADAAQVGPYLDLARELTSLLVQIYPGRLQSLRLSLQGGIPASSHESLTAAMLSGALRHVVEGPVTPVNAARIAKDQNVRFHCEATSMKRDFMLLIRVEAVIDEVRHFASGTVLGHRHGRLVELDGYIIDAIPEGPLLVTFHRDEPGVVGKLGTALGDLGINITRMQIGMPQNGDSALGILNLDQAPAADQLDRLRTITAIERLALVI